MSECANPIRGYPLDIRFGQVVHCVTRNGPCADRFMVVSVEDQDGVYQATQVIRLNDGYNKAGHLNICNLNDRSAWHLAEDQS